MQYVAIHYNNCKLTITNCIERNNHSGHRSHTKLLYTVLCMNNSIYGMQ